MMTASRAVRLAVALTVVLSHSVIADEKPVEFRQHYQIASDDIVLYSFTTITRLADDVEENILLIRDEGHGDFVGRRVWSFEDQKVTYRISDLKDRAFVQNSAKMPFTSKTRRETMAEGRRNPAIGQDTPVIVKIETNGGEWDGIHTEWEEYSRLRELRHSMRQTLDPFLLEAIERMRGTLFATASGDAYYERIGRYVVYGPDSDHAAPSIKTTRSQPDCDFDKAFGYACSAKQLERVTKAVKEGRELETY